MLVLLIGPPGVGKGTQLFLLQKALKVNKIPFKYFIFGDEFRRLAKEDKTLKEKLANGDLIDDDNVNKVFNLLNIPVDVTISNLFFFSFL